MAPARIKFIPFDDDELRARARVRVVGVQEDRSEIKLARLESIYCGRKYLTLQYKSNFRCNA